jgi:predicted SAM-dependent methyltransferase
MKMPATPKQKKLLNLGCGNHYHKDWVNIDFVSRSKDVIEHNLLGGIPYPDNFFDVVYHSHVLEHFTKRDALEFIKGCYRVLKPGGIIRIAVPDLETITKNYLSFLEGSIAGDKMSEANYDWTMLEMYDQAVRNYGGGEMKTYYRQDTMINEDFVRERMGKFFEIMTQKRGPQSENTWKNYIKKIFPVTSIINFLRSIKNVIPGENHRQLGKFRMSGEIHQWMYDRFSLSRLLKTTGFKEIIQRSPRDSYVENWARYDLDSEPNGDTYKPDSLFMEAKK